MERAQDELGAPVSVGFIGLGNMGAPMAAAIAQKGFDLTVFDKREAAMSPLLALGAKRAASAGELAANVDVLCICVFHDHEVKELFEAPGGVLERARPGLICAVHSTVLPHTVIDLARRAEALGVKVVDAPVSRSQSDTSHLTVILGGEPLDIERIAPVLSSFGGRLITVGEAGMAQVAKLANNMMGAANQVIAMEAVRYAEAFGLDKDKLFDVVRVSAGASWAASNYDLYDRLPYEHELGGTPELPHRLTKDLVYALETAQERWTYLPVVSLCSQLLPSMLIERWQRSQQRE